MAQYNRELEELGRDIQEIVDRAINSNDFRHLNQTIRQTVGKAVDTGAGAVRKSIDTTARQINRKVIRAEEQNHLPALYSNPNKTTAKGIAKVIGGGVLTLVTGMGLLSSAILGAIFGGAGVFGFGEIAALGGLGFGTWSLCSGIHTLGMVGRFKSYRRALGQNTHIALEKLARAVGKNVKFVRRELRGMINQGLFLEGHLDHEETSLITSDETYKYYEQSRLQQQEQQRLEAARQAEKTSWARDVRVQEVLDKGNTFLRDIRSCNDAIPGKEISDKITRIEILVQRIFERAESHPEIVPDLKKMMDYYLPMTVKLLKSYADMDAQPVQGNNIINAKREIEETLDTLNLAFEKLLDSVFLDTALDVSSDISVLNTLLAQEGLTEDGISNMKNQET